VRSKHDDLFGLYRVRERERERESCFIMGSAPTKSITCCEDKSGVVATSPRSSIHSASSSSELATSSKEDEEPKVSR
jgi:hypothetical protein